jgi:hypothetical protein
MVIVSAVVHDFRSESARAQRAHMAIERLGGDPLRAPPACDPKGPHAHVRADRAGMAQVAHEAPRGRRLAGLEGRLTLDHLQEHLVGTVRGDEAGQVLTRHRGNGEARAIQVDDERLIGLPNLFDHERSQQIAPREISDLFAEKLAPPAQRHRVARFGRGREVLGQVILLTRRRCQPGEPIMLDIPRLGAVTTPRAAITC